MLQQLALLRGRSGRADPTSAEFIHTVVECTKLAFADREKFYGDPNFVEVPGETLLSEAYNAERRKLVGERASLEQRPGTIKGFGKQLDARVVGQRTVAAGAGEPTVGRVWTHDDDDDPSIVVVDGAKSIARARCAATPHFDIIDTAGNRSATPSGLAAILPTIPELASPGSRAQQFGSTTSQRAGARQAPAHHATPSMALRDGEPYLPGARPAATSRTTGPRSSSYDTSIAE
jgi:gamma-glutamyltranspeptidase/glutathione hydrolase